MAVLERMVLQPELVLVLLLLGQEQQEVELPREPQMEVEQPNEQEQLVREGESHRSRVQEELLPDCKELQQCF